MDRKTHKRPAYYVTTYNGTSDLAGQLVAAFASSSIAFRGVDDRYSDKLMTAALRLYGAATRHSGRYTKPFVYKCAPDDPNAQLRAPNKPQCKPADVVFKGSAVGLFNSTSYRDDLTWAAAWMNRATGDRAYLDDAYKYFVQHSNEEGQADQRLLVDWDHVAWPATVLLASITDDAAFHKPAQDFLARWLCTSSVVSYTDLGRAYNHFDPRVGTTMNVAMLSAVYGKEGKGGEGVACLFVFGDGRSREARERRTAAGTEKKMTTHLFFLLLFFFFLFFSTFL
jgi:endoglucanase